MKEGSPDDRGARLFSAREETEIRVFLEALRIGYGYDFREYAWHSLCRRIASLPQTFGVNTVADLIPLLLHQPAILPTLLAGLTISVTELFRTPSLLGALKEEVFPFLRSYPRITIWVAGCATGEEAWSLIILLKEAGLLPYTQIFATDINGLVLTQAEEGHLSEDALEAAQSRYEASGGQGCLKDHFLIDHGIARLQPDLKARLVFGQHNLVSDGVFCETHLILCHHVMIYFSSPLREHVLKRFAESLARQGFLAVGPRECLRPIECTVGFEPFNALQGIYQKIE